jgi:pSer/pThr/pTyr-binding forkhead associated (FHA) protein
MANVQLLSYLEQFGPQRAKGTLSVQDPSSGEEGSICLSGGIIVMAATSRLKDLPAVLTMMAWEHASVLWLEGQSPPALSCDIQPDLAIFEFVQLEMEYGSAKAVLDHILSTVENERPKKRKTIRLPDLSNFSIHLQMEDDPSGNSDFELREGTQLIGKGSDCDIIIAHSTISRRHCQVALVDRTITLADLGSTNGTYVNGQLIHQEFVVPGDKVTLGSVPFLVAARLRRNLSHDTMPTSVAVTPQNSNTIKIPKNSKAVHWQNLGAEADKEKKNKPDKSLIRRFLKKNP